MNRLPALLRRQIASTTVPSPSTPSRLREFGSSDLAFPYMQFVPEHYEPGYEYPVVVWLHSDASSEAELAGVMNTLSQRNYVGLSLRGTQSSRKRGAFYEWSLTPHAVALATDMIFDSVEYLADRLSIHPQKIFLAGYGKGGTLAQTIGLRNPERFAGVVSVNGPFPTAPCLLTKWKQAKSLPILWMHGNQSRQCSMDAMCEMLKLAFTSALAIHPIQFHCGDDLHHEMLAKANRFLMQIVTNQPIELHETMVAGVHEENEG